MSYMDRDNILKEGFLDKLGKKIKKLTVKGIAKLSPKNRKDYKKALQHAKEANDIFDDLLKRNNIKFP
jgi:hypothetical protein